MSYESGLRTLQSARDTAAYTTRERAIARQQALVDAQVDRLVRLQNLPDEPTTDDPEGALVIWFQRAFGGVVYTYAGVKARTRWYLTGARNPGAMTWDQFMDWLGDDLRGDIWVARAWDVVE